MEKTEANNNLATEKSEANNNNNNNLIDNIELHQSLTSFLEDPDFRSRSYRSPTESRKTVSNNENESPDQSKISYIDDIASVENQEIVQIPVGPHQLFKKEWMEIASTKKRRGKSKKDDVPGIYVFGYLKSVSNPAISDYFEQIKSNSNTPISVTSFVTVEPLYLGKSIHVLKRIQEHRRSSTEELSNFIKGENQGNILIKYIKDTEFALKEGHYLNVFEGKYKRRFRFNSKSGDGELRTMPKDNKIIVNKIVNEYRRSCSPGDVTSEQNDVTIVCDVTIFFQEKTEPDTTYTNREMVVLNTDLALPFLNVTLPVTYVIDLSPGITFPFEENDIKPSLGGDITLHIDTFLQSPGDALAAPFTGDAILLSDNVKVSKNDVTLDRNRRVSVDDVIKAKRIRVEDVDATLLKFDQ